MNKTSIGYYSARVLQRILLCLVVGATIIHWIILISIMTSTNYVAQLKNHELTDPTALNATISRAIDTQTLTALKWSCVALAATMLLLFIGRFRKFEKRTIVDSLVIIVFCLLSVALAQMIVRAFISGL